MAIKTLAVKYRPQTFDDVVEQDSTKTILRYQLETGTIKNCYLFTGPAGTGKTTQARIFANELNNHEGNIIEMDAASHSSVDDVRDIIAQAKTKSLDSEYKTFLIDECHALSNTAWQAFLKLIEEPPAKSIFIFCTTDPQKIPNTILSRVQRYNISKISMDGLRSRIKYIIKAEQEEGRDISCTHEAIDYICKQAEGGMRDCITLLDKCLSFKDHLDIQDVIKALGCVEYDVYFSLTDAMLDKDLSKVVTTIEQVHADGKDLKTFIKVYMDFLLDLCKYGMLGNFTYLNIPPTQEYTEKLREYTENDFVVCKGILNTVVKINSDIKWENNPKPLVEALLLQEAVC